MPVRFELSDRRSPINLDDSYRPSDVERFWALVEKTETCWLWKGRFDEGGYGLFYVNGKSQKAHRVANAIDKGPIPPNLKVRHVCSKHHCVRPNHTFRDTKSAPRGHGPNEKTVDIVRWHVEESLKRGHSHHRSCAKAAALCGLTHERVRSLTRHLKAKLSTV